MLREQLLKQIRCKECQPLIEALIACAEAAQLSFKALSTGNSPMLPAQVALELEARAALVNALTALEKLSGDV